jgi:AAA+ ATPase superfamily predicted ATPase
MIRRNALKLVKYRLSHFSSVALTGPRQIGKTTIARMIASEFGDEARYLDLEDPIERLQLADASAYFTAHADKLIILSAHPKSSKSFVFRLTQDGASAAKAANFSCLAQLQWTC